MIQVADQCTYGLKTWSQDRRKKDRAAKKKRKFMTNCQEIAEELSRRCNGKHEHQPLLEGRAKQAAQYPE